MELYGEKGKFPLYADSLGSVLEALKRGGLGGE